MAALDALGSALAGIDPTEFTVGLFLALVVCWFIMHALRRTIGLPMVVSALIVPFIVAGGFLLAFGVHLYLDLPLLHAAALLGSALIPLTVAYDQLFGTPG
jgi:hypothetical protein